LVNVDVTVQDKSGHPIHGLKREDFTLTENKQPQTFSYFEENSTQTPPAAGPELPPMPSGTFTDYTPVPPNGTLNVLLLDSLNTPMADQSYVRYQLQQYVKKAKPGTRIAIFGLSRRLFLLQGFNSDSQVLKNAVEHKLLPRASSLLDDPLGAGSTPAAPSELASGAMPNGADSSSAQLASVVSNMQQFEAEQKAFATQLRVQYTLDAFQDLAHYLAAFPGRKNLIWFSGSFPINILPDPTIKDVFAVMENNDAEFRETTSLLSHAQVAVYPVDARGLVAEPTISAASRKGDPKGTGLSAFSQSQSSEHMTMGQLAEETGGKAFYNTNDLATAVQNAIESGSDYYTLTYAPSNRNLNGAYREIHVVLNGNLQAVGYRLTYRRGYFIDDRNTPSKSLSTATTKPDSVPPVGSGDMHVRAAMAHGAPMPEDILFKARVLPIGSATESTLAPNNTLAPVRPMKPPFRRFAIDVVAVPYAFQLTLDKDGHRTGAIEFSALLYDNDGNPLNATGKTVPLNLTPEGYKGFLTGVNGHFEISVPVKADNNFLRIGIRDIPSNRMGVVEVPIASVARLTPLPAAPAATSVQTQPSPNHP
jgi:VWFA-related protein